MPYDEMSYFGIQPVAHVAEYYERRRLDRKRRQALEAINRR